MTCSHQSHLGKCVTHPLLSSAKGDGEDHYIIHLSSQVIMQSTNGSFFMVQKKHRVDIVKAIFFHLVQLIFHRFFLFSILVQTSGNN